MSILTRTLPSIKPFSPTPLTTLLSPLLRQQSTMSRPPSFPSYLISPSTLSSTLSINPPSTISSNPRIRPLCASWFLPNHPQRLTGLSTYTRSHIPSSQFLDIDTLKDASSPYPHMLPSAADFAAAMSELGIKKEDTVVVYDSQEQGLFSAPRVGWMFGVMGHERVHVLDNYRGWVEGGWPVEEGEPRVVGEGERSVYPVPEVRKEKVVGFEEMKAIAMDNTEGVQILDARPYGRWAGTAPEPRPGLSSGHMPGSISVPYSELLDPKTGTLLPREDLRRVFEKKGVDLGKPVISSCGTGVTAAVVDMALGETGAGAGENGDRRVYDGSWTEWAQRVKEEEGLIKKST